MGCMGKTISLKLTEREQQVIVKLNEQGISKSDLLRNALHQYIASIPEFASTDNQIKNVFVNDKEERIFVSESFKELKQEMQQLREQMKKTQKQVESTVMAFQRQLYLFSITTLSSQQIPSPFSLDIAQDIHQQIDDFLTKRREKAGE